MSSEYEKLRDEIIIWQERRFKVFTGTITLLFVFVSYILASAKAWSWATAMSIEFLVVACACLVSWFGGWANSIAGAYISVMHENDPAARWENVTQRLRDRMPIASLINMNSVFATIYVLFLSASMLLFTARCPTPPSRLDLVGMICLMLLCLVCLLANLAPQISYPRSAFRKRIREILNETPPAPPSSP
jgi:glucan phosphoethanolaminetransferase (alkaline phosphatase superfamily)